MMVSFARMIGRLLLGLLWWLVPFDLWGGRGRSRYRENPAAYRPVKTGRRKRGLKIIEDPNAPARLHARADAARLEALEQGEEAQPSVAQAWEQRDVGQDFFNPPKAD